MKLVRGNILALVVLSVLPACAAARERVIPRYHLSLRNVNTRERLPRLEVVNVDPRNRNLMRVDREALKRFSRFVRDWRTGRTRRVPERLLWNLYLVGAHFDAPIEIVSGYRSRARRTSRHRHAAAVDFRVVGVPSKVVWEYCKRFRRVGLGYYPKSGFVHLDVRDRSAYWIDDSGPGEAPRYRAGVKQPRPERRHARRARARR